jgi:hypothetical protein
MLRPGKVGRTLQKKMAMGIFLLEIVRNIVRLIYRMTVTIFINKSQSENCHEHYLTSVASNVTRQSQMGLHTDNQHVYMHP